MHKIKLAARRSAWHNQDDDPPYSRYNPFGRMNPRGRTGVDTENGLHLVQSAPDASPVDAHGRSIDAEFGRMSPRGRTGVDEESGLREVISTIDEESGLREVISAIDDGVILRITQHSYYHNTFPMTTEDEYADRKRDVGSLAKSSRARTEVDKENGLRDAPSAPNGLPIGYFNAEQTSNIAGNYGTTDAQPRKRKLRALLSFGQKKDAKDLKRRIDNKSAKHKPVKSKKKRPDISFTSQSTWITILLVSIPIGVALNYALPYGEYDPGFKTNAIIDFVVNFIAIIPLAALLSYATEETAIYSVRLGVSILKEFKSGTVAALDILFGRSIRSRSRKSSLSQIVIVFALMISTVAALPTGSPPDGSDPGPVADGIALGKSYFMPALPLAALVLMMIFLAATFISVCCKTINRKTVNGKTVNGKTANRKTVTGSPYLWVVAVVVAFAAHILPEDDYMKQAACYIWAGLYGCNMLREWASHSKPQTFFGLTIILSGIFMYAMGAELDDSNRMLYALAMTACCKAASVIVHKLDRIIQWWARIQWTALWTALGTALWTAPSP